MKIPPAILAMLGIGSVMAFASKANAAESPHAPLAAGNRDFIFPPLRPRLVSEDGYTFIKNEEGFRERVYQDVGKNAIGYGHNFTPGDGLKVTTVLTRAQADALLRKDMVSREASINRAIKQDVALTQNMFNALASLVYNIGTGAFEKSTLVKLLNVGDYIGAGKQFDVWINSGGKVDPVLVGRRNREHNLFLTRG